MMEESGPVKHSRIPEFCRRPVILQRHAGRSGRRGTGNVKFGDVNMTNSDGQAPQHRPAARVLRLAYPFVVLAIASACGDKERLSVDSGSPGGSGGPKGAPA